MIAAPLEAPNSSIDASATANPAEAVGKAGIYSTLADVAGFKTRTVIPIGYKRRFKWRLCLQ